MEKLDKIQSKEVTFLNFLFLIKCNINGSLLKDSWETDIFTQSYNHIIIDISTVITELELHYKVENFGRYNKELYNTGSDILRLEISLLG